MTKKGECLRWLKEVAVPFSGESCLIWPFERSYKGYGRIHVRGRRRAAHRMVCEVVKGPPPSEAYDTAHSCGMGHLACVNPRHLRWATRKENINEKNQHGTMAKGSRNGNAKMNEQTAMQIKMMLGTMSQSAIAKCVGISRSAVRDVKIGKSWAWLS